MKINPHMIFMRVEWSGEVGSGVGKWEPPWVPQGIHPGEGTPPGGSPSGTPPSSREWKWVGNLSRDPPEGGDPLGLSVA